VTVQATYNRPRATGARVTLQATYNRPLVILAIGVVLFIVVQSFDFVGGYLSFILALICSFTVLTVALSMLAGLSGIWSLGHTAFFAMGAYLAANLPEYGVPLELICCVAFLVAALSGFFLGFSVGRFSMLYFGLLTLAVALTADEIIGRWSDVTGGDNGKAVPPIWSILCWRDLGIHDGAPVSIIIATLSLLLFCEISRGPIGRRWLAVKSQRAAAMAIGLFPAFENAVAFAISAGVASLAGVSFAIVSGYLDPGTFDLSAATNLVVAAVVGGVGSLAGAVAGAVFIVTVPELTPELKELSPFIFGLAIILVLSFMRRGIVPTIGAGVAAFRQGQKKSLARSAAPERDICSLVKDIVPFEGQALEVRDVSVTFGGIKALDKISLTVPAGSVVGLLGPNGAGKTTLLNVLSGFVKPTSCGALTLGGIDLAKLSAWERSGVGFGRTFQHAELFSELTLRETLVVAAEKGRMARIRAGTTIADPHQVAQHLIECLNLEHVADLYPRFLPFGIQKVGDIGRMLAGGCGVIALDEPFSGLDHEESAQLRSIIQVLRASGATILIIDHAVQEVMDISDEIVVLDFGCLIVHGAPAEVRQNEKFRFAYFGAQASVGNV
jgi:ABC-type branched-subunit amino acid transport system ATPase component/ABC-type branched-subunit amino acid transport system permease subunit